MQSPNSEIMIIKQCHSTKDSEYHTPDNNEYQAPCRSSTWVGHQCWLLESRHQYATLRTFCSKFGHTPLECRRRIVGFARFLRRKETPLTDANNNNTIRHDTNTIPGLDRVGRSSPDVWYLSLDYRVLSHLTSTFYLLFVKLKWSPKLTAMEPGVQI